MGWPREQRPTLQDGVFTRATAQNLKGKTNSSKLSLLAADTWVYKEVVIGQTKFAVSIKVARPCMHKKLRYQDY
jgi:hypothetical protein